MNREELAKIFRSEKERLEKTASGATMWRAGHLYDMAASYNKMIEMIEMIEELKPNTTGLIPREKYEIAREEIKRLRREMQELQGRLNKSQEEADRLFRLMYDDNMGLYDSDTGESVKAEKIHITDGGYIELKYAQVKRGRIVQINHGSRRVHYFYDEPEGQKMIIEDAFRNGVGLSYILGNAP